MRRTETDELVSPFLGGGNLEVACAQQGARVFGSDIFAPLVCFWEHLLNDPHQLADAVQKYLTANVNDNGDAFKQLQGFIPKMPNGLERAAAFYVVNRLSYLGLTVKRRSKLTPDRRPILTPLASVPGPAARRVAVS